MKLSVQPTRIEIVDKENVHRLIATVVAVDDSAVKVEFFQAVGWNEWLNLTDAVRKAMHMMDKGAA
jgi:hypothetical protein